MHFLYIIYSKKINKYYVGETSNMKNRLELHNKHHFVKAYTKSSDDWIIKLSFECINRKSAIFLEKFIKRMKSRNFLEKVIEKPEILSDILSKK